MILGGIHGNESCGIQTVNFLKDIKIKRGKLILMYGNLQAMERNIRQTEANLNRMFKADMYVTDEEKTSYEYKRSKEIMPYLKESDILLDIHSSSTKDSTPFIICERNASDIVKIFPFNIRCYGFDNLHPGGTDSFMNKEGKMGICIECGNHEDSLAFSRAQECALRLLSNYNMILIKDIAKNSGKQKVLQAISIYKNKNENYKSSKAFKDFEKITPGQIIAYDGEEKVISDKTQYIVFSREKLTIPKQEAFVLLEEVQE